MSQFPVCGSCGNSALRAFENLRPLIWLAVQFLFRCSLCFWLLWSLRVLGFPRLQLCGSVVHRGGPIHGEVCVLERAEVEVFPVVPSQEIRGDVSGELLPLLLLLFKMFPQLHLRSEPFALRVKEVDVKSARGLSLLPLDNLQRKGFKESSHLIQCLNLSSPAMWKGIVKIERLSNSCLCSSRWSSHRLQVLDPIDRVFVPSKLHVDFVGCVSFHFPLAVGF